MPTTTVAAAAGGIVAFYSILFFAVVKICTLIVLLHSIVSIVNTDLNFYIYKDTQLASQQEFSPYVSRPGNLFVHRKKENVHTL